MEDQVLNAHKFIKIMEMIFWKNKLKSSMLSKFFRNLKLKIK